MATTSPTHHYERCLTFKDKALHRDMLSQCHLSIYISDTYFKVSCVHLKTTQHLLLEVYRLKCEGASQRTHAIAHIYQHHPLLAMDQWATVTLCVGNQTYALIPQSLFQEKQVDQYLRLTTDRTTQTRQYFTHPALGVTVAFAMDTWLSPWLQKTYHQTPSRTIHQASSLIQGTWVYFQRIRTRKLSQVFIFMEVQYLHITVLQKGSLRYYNRFVCTDDDAWLRYVLIVLHTLQLAPNTYEVVIGGHATQETHTYLKARKYLQQLTFIDTIPGLKFGSTFPKKNIPTHLDVLNTHFC